MIGNGSTEGLIQKVKDIALQSGFNAETLKDLTLAGLLIRLSDQVKGKDKSVVQSLMEKVEQLGLGGQSVRNLI